MAHLTFYSNVHSKSLFNTITQKKWRKHRPPYLLMMANAVLALLLLCPGASKTVMHSLHDLSFLAYAQSFTVSSDLKDMLLKCFIQPWPNCLIAVVTKIVSLHRCCVIKLWNHLGCMSEVCSPIAPCVECQCTNILVHELCKWGCVWEHVRASLCDELIGHKTESKECQAEL